MSKRIFYASHAVAVVNTDNPYAGVNEAVPGAQSVSINTSYNLEQVFQLGRLALYDNFPANPEVEITINKALDGRPLIWNYYTGVDSMSLQNASSESAAVILGIGDDADPDDDGTLNPLVSAITMTGCFVSSLNYTFPVEGNFTEELAFVGNSKTAGGAVVSPPENPDLRIIRRQNFRMEDSLLPSSIVGKCLTSVTISADLGRESIYCLGEYAPFHRFVNFPLEITVAFDVHQKGENPICGPDILALEDAQQCRAPEGFIGKEEIVIKVCRTLEGNDGVSIAYEFDLGSGCALQSVSYSGGDTGGGNVTETHTYITYNELTIAYTPS